MMIVCNMVTISFFQINNTITLIVTFQFKVEILALSFKSCPSLVKLFAALPT